MLIRTLWTLSVRTRTFLRRWMPTNILLDRLRTRRGLKWGVPAMGLGIVYFLAAAVSIALINGGWSPWLYVVFALCLWNALKFLLMGPISVILLVRARTREAIVRHCARRQTATHIGSEVCDPLRPCWLDRPMGRAANHDERRVCCLSHRASVTPKSPS